MSDPDSVAGMCFGPLMPLPPFPEATQRAVAVAGVGGVRRQPAASDGFLSARERALCDGLGIAHADYLDARARQARW